MISTSLTLLCRVQRPENQDAWARFVEIYAPLLHHTVRRAGVSERHAEDVVQDVLLHLLREMPAFRYDPGRGQFRGWLATVTARKCYEFLRRRSSDGGVGGPDDALREVAVESSVHDYFHAEFESEVIRRAMEIMQSEFEERTWQACWQRLHGRSAADVGRELSMSEAAVFTATGRVLRRLRAELAGMLD